MSGLTGRLNEGFRMVNTFDNTREFQRRIEASLHTGLYFLEALA